MDRLELRLLSAVAEASADFKMLEAGDRVMACISGGKDSFALLDACAERAEAAGGAEYRQRDAGNGLDAGVDELVGALEHAEHIVRVGDRDGGKSVFVGELGDLRDRQRAFKQRVGRMHLEVDELRQRLLRVGIGCNRRGWLSLGLETAAYLALALASIYAYRQRRPYTAAVLLALATLVRGDGLIVREHATTDGWQTGTWTPQVWRMAV